MDIDMQEYLKNRVLFPLDELGKHAGEWVAWSPDGTRIVADSRDPEALDDLIRAVGEDPEQCVVEGIPDSDSVIGGLDSPLELRGAGRGAILAPNPSFPGRHLTHRSP